MDQNCLSDRMRLSEDSADKLIAAAIHVVLVRGDSDSQLEATDALRQISEGLERHPIDAVNALAELALRFASEVEDLVKSMDPVPQGLSLKGLLTGDSQADYYVQRYLQLKVAADRFGDDSHEAIRERAAIIRSLNRSENQPAAVSKGAQVLAMRLAASAVTQAAAQIRELGVPPVDGNKVEAE